MKNLAVELPDLLHQRIEAFVHAGGASSPEQTVLEAVRRFLETHDPLLVEKAGAGRRGGWGLRGTD